MIRYPHASCQERRVSWIHHQLGRRGGGLWWPGGQRTECRAKTELSAGV